MSHRHLTMRDREILERLISKGYSQRKIASVLGFSQSAISQEIKRNRGTHLPYRAELAASRTIRRRKKIKGKFRKDSDFLINFIKEKLQLFWSPEQISGRLKLLYPDDPSKHVCFKTIYSWIRMAIDYQYRNLPLRGYSKYLRTVRGRHRVKNFKIGTRSLRRDLPPIESRPANDGFGDWESDLICGARRTAYIATFVERKTGFIWAEKCNSKASEEYNNAAMRCFSRFGLKNFKTVTVDRGKEFYRVDKLDIPYYFCNPVSPNERALNENMNALLRQYFPRTKDFTKVTHEEIYHAVNEINNRPKKRFGYRTTIEYMQSLGIAI